MYSTAMALSIILKYIYEISVPWRNKIQLPGSGLQTATISGPKYRFSIAYDTNSIIVSVSEKATKLPHYTILSH
jgi:hypothetical protein